MDEENWFQENLRIIVSIFIVGAIALGIYSYSQSPERERFKEEQHHETEEADCMKKFGDLPISDREKISFRCYKYFD